MFIVCFLLSMAACSIGCGGYCLAPSLNKQTKIHILKYRIFIKGRYILYLLQKKASWQQVSLRFGEVKPCQTFLRQRVFTASQKLLTFIIEFCTWHCACADEVEESPSSIFTRPKQWFRNNASKKKLSSIKNFIFFNILINLLTCLDYLSAV